MKKIVYLLFACIFCLLLIPFCGKTQEPFQFGVNGFHWTPLDKLDIFQQERMYVYWEWLEGSPGKIRFEPAAGAQGRFDTKLMEMKLKGIKPILCVFNSPEWIQKVIGVADPEAAPYTGDPESPESYRYFSRVLFQVAARYGRKYHDRGELLLDTTERWYNDGKNKLMSGVDLLEYIEPWNEPNKFWKPGQRANMSARQYAAMLSACYDGHEGLLGPGFGIKTADPSMKVIMAGLAGMDTAYLKDMKRWFSENRKDKAFAADIINVHHYCNFGGSIGEGTDYGIAPESDQIREKLSAVVQLVSRIAPGKKVYWSEFGYDTDHSSPQYAKTENAQNWLVRCYLEAMCAGIAGAHIYSAADERDPSKGLFQSSGLLFGENSGKAWTPKDNYGPVAQMSKHLKGKRLIGQHTSADGTRMLIFEDGDAVLYATWNPKGRVSRRPTVDQSVRYYYIRR